MKVSAQDIGQRQLLLEVEVDDERLKKAYDQAFQRVVNRINVPGFRRGKAPRPIVERMVGRESILEDAVDKLVPLVYREALEDQRIEPGGQASVEVTSSEPLHFKATVPLKPAVVLGDYRSIEIPLDPAVVEEGEIDAVVESLRESNALWVPVERPLQMGDRAGLDLQARRGERLVTDARDAEFILNAGGNEPLPGFSQQLVGLEAGQERSFQLAGGQDAEGEPVPPTEFTVKIHWVKEKQLPEADDDFAQSVGQTDTFEELRANIRQRLLRQKELQARAKQAEAAIQAAIDQATIEIPPQLVQQQAQEMVDSMGRRLDNQGITIQQYLQFTGKSEEDFKLEVFADAELSLKQALVLESIAEAEQLTVSDEEVRQEIEGAAQTADDPARAARQALARPETRERIASMIRSRKGRQRLIELAGGSPEETADADLAELSTVSGASDE